MSELLILALAGGFGVSVAALLAASGAAEPRAVPARVRARRHQPRR